MRLIINRNCQVILSKMLLSDTAVSSSDIRESLDISRKTLTAEIQKLDSYLRNYGACIRTVKGIGYAIEKLNPEIFDEFKEEFLRHFYRDRYMYYDRNHLTYFIVMEYLVSDDYIKLDTLAEKYFYSKSTISQNIKKAKKYLKKFNLRLESRPGYGLIISGGEWNKRICIMFTAKIANGINFMQKDTIQIINTFRKMILREQDNFAVIKSYMEPYLQKFRIYIPYVYQTIICNYILLSQNRLKWYDCLEIAREHIESVQGTIYYVAARDLACFFISKGYIIKENDIIALAILMDSYATRDEKSKINKELYEICVDDTYSFINYISELYPGVERCFDQEFITEFAFYLVGLRRRLFYQLPSDEEGIFSAKHEGSFMADLCVDFARFFYNKHGIWLTTAELMQSYYIFASSFNRNVRYRAQYRAVLVSLYGVHFARDVSARLMRLYDRDMVEIVPMELTEVNHSNLSKYDLIITDIAKKHIVESKLPILFFDVYRENYLHSLDNFISDSIAGKLRRIIKGNNIIRNTKFRKKEHVFNYIAKKFVEPNKREEFLKDCRKNNELLTCERKNAIAVITTYPKYYNKREVVIIINSTSFYWDNEQVQMILFFNRRKFLYKDILIMNTLQRRLLGDAAGIVQKIASMDEEALISYIANLE